MSYRYNATGDLVSMEDWLGTTTFELDLLHQLTAATDHRGDRVEYTYDGVGNQTEIRYPDGTKAAYEYDLVHNQTKVTETDGSETTFAYDGMARVTEMHYPNGWVEYYTYDKMGRILSVDDTHPSEKPAKTQKHTYRYDANGNIVYEYMRGNGTGQAKNETLYTYDALNRLVSAHDNYGNSTRNYTYDSLGNLTFETGMGSHNCDYIYNNLNQQIDRSVDDWKTHTASTYDKRGNLVLEEFGKNKQLTVSGQYEFDETNRMVRGVNGNGEESIYTYNGLGALMEQTWIIAKNGYGYHNVSANPDDLEPDVPDLPDPDPDLPDVPDPDPNPGINNEGNGNQDKGNDGNGHVNGNNGNHNGQSDDVTPEEPAAPAVEPQQPEAAPELELESTVVQYGGQPDKGNNGENGGGNKDKPTGSDVKKTSTVIKEFVVDFSTDTFRPLMEHEVNGLDYRYVYSDKARLSVVVQGIEHGSSAVLDDRGELHAYYHCDYLGTTDYLTSAVDSRVIAWTSYSEWGEISHNAVLKCGQRELDLVKEYATHDYDAVLNMYYAKARFYDADNRHFTAVDPILDPSQYDLRAYTRDPMQLVQYLYVKDNAINWIDPLGEFFVFSHEDNSGDTYYEIVAQSTIDGYISNVVPAFGYNWQTVIHGVRTDGVLVGGTSVIDPTPSVYDSFTTIHKAEIDAIKESIKQIPNGEKVVAAAEFAEEALGLFITAVEFKYEIKPMVDDTVARDKVIIQAMKDASIPTNRNYSPNFFDNVNIADEFVKEYSWFFAATEDYAGMSAYEIGKAVNSGNEKDYAKARNKIREKVEDQLYYALRTNVGYYVPAKKPYDPPIFICVDYGLEKTLRLNCMVWGKQLTDAILQDMETNYLNVKKYFRTLFCDSTYQVE